jgi:hypothetical protein
MLPFLFEFFLPSFHEVCAGSREFAARIRFAGDLYCFLKVAFRGFQSRQAKDSKIAKTGFTRLSGEQL